MFAIRACHHHQLQFVHTRITMTDTSVYIDIYMGDRIVHVQEQAEYDATASMLSKNTAIYGLPTLPADLSEEQRQILSEIDVLGLYL